MEKDRFGNLIFSHDTAGDKQRVLLISRAIGRAVDTTGKNQAPTNNRAKAMIDAGLLPDVEDTLATKPMPLDERVYRFTRSMHRIPMVVIREDEIEATCEILNTVPLDHDHESRALERYQGEDSKKAQELAGEIHDLQPGESAS